jgi:fibronectin type 3 domain-containing protein
MKLKLKAGIILGLLTLLGVAVQPVHASPPAGYTLVWDDEFSSTAPSVTYPSGDPNETVTSPPDAAFWSYDTGAGVWGNSEIETYTTSNATIVTDVAATNGTALDINAVLSGGNWTSSRIKTSASAVKGTQPQYGYLESSIEVPTGSGLWPKWWAQGTDVNLVGWPEAGEADLIQSFGDDPLTAFSTDFYGTTNAYFDTSNPVTIPAGYNVYGYLWTPTEEWNYLNGYSVSPGPNLYNTASTSLVGGAFNQPFYLLYDLAVGSASSPGGQTGVETTGDLKVGYVRVYQATGSVQTATNVANETPTVLAGGTHPIAPGTYQVTAQSQTADRLTLTGNGTANGNGLDAEASTGPTTAAQAWTFGTASVVPAGDYNISVDGPYCLQGGGWFPGTYAEIWGCDGGSLQSWNVVASGSDYQIQQAVIPPASENGSASALCLTDVGGTFELEACSTATSDEYTILPLTPGGPTGLTASAAAGGVAPVTLSWTATPGALIYRVFKSTVSGAEGNPAYAAGLTTPGYTDTGVVAGSTYYYKVTAVSAGGAGPFSNEASVTLAPAAPATLTGTATTGGINPVTLNWAASAGATGYQVFRGTIQIGTTAAAITYSDTAASSGVANSYTVKAVNAGGTSAASTAASVTLAPASPTGLAAVAGNTDIVLSWTASTGATIYRVFRTTVSGTEANPATYAGITTPGYTDTNVVNGTKYYYKVTAVNTAGASPMSTEASATAGAAGPGAPTLNSATAAAGGIGPITLAWTVGAGPAPTVYRVFRSTVSGAEANPAYAAGITTTAYTDAGTLTAGYTYYYKVTAVNANGASPFSNEKSALLTPAAPGAPTGTATAGAAPVTLNWTASYGATGYSVYRGTIELGSTSTPTFTDTSVVAAGVSVSYTVTATNAAGTSVASAAGSILLHPQAPIGLTATGGNNEITLHWTASVGATVYRVFRSTTSGGEANPAYAAGLTTTTYTDTAAPNGTTFFYEVTAINTAGASGFSNEASAFGTSGAPGTPTLNTATAAANGVGPIVLTWTVGAGPAPTVYRIFRSTTSGGEGNPATYAGITTTAYTDAGPFTQGITYYYKVAGVNNAGASALSNQLGVLLSPAASTGLSATASAGGTAPVTLNWTASTGSTGFNVYRGTVEIGSTAAVTFSDTSVVPAGVNVSYTVTSVNSAGTSPASAAATALLQPAAPTNLVATPGVSEVFLNWTASPGATVYRLFRSTTSGGEGNPATFTGLGGTSFTDTTTVNGTTYYYKLTAANGAGASGFSNETSADPGTQDPATNLTATAAALGTAPITLNWTAAPGAGFYRIFRSLSAGGENVNSPLAVGITGTTYTDNAVSAGLTYYYKITAVSNIAASVFSNEASATLTPQSPALTATAGVSTITLNWTASVGATGYSVSRGLAAGLETLLTTTVGANYVDTGVTPGTVYFYKVKAINAGGTSASSNEVHTQTAPAIPTITSVAAAAGGVAPVTVTWTSVANATSYVVYRSTSSGAETLVGAETSPYVDGTASAAGATYFYKVAAVNPGGTSLLSAEGSAALTPSAVSNLQITSATGATPIALAWTTSPGTTGFQVYRGTSASPLTLLTTGAGSTYSDAAAAAGGTYYYTVTQVNSGGTSIQSNEVGPQTVIAAVPGLFETNMNGPGEGVQFDWGSVSGATSYNVYRSTTPGGETFYQNTPNAPGITLFSDPSANAAGATYYYKITSVNAGGESALSGEIFYTVAPATPTNVQAITNGVSNDNLVYISWTASPGATSYFIYRATSPGGENYGGFPIAIANSLASTVDINATQIFPSGGNLYYYTVEALNNGGTSAPSSESGPGNPCPTIDAPTSPSAVPDAIVGNDVSWTDSLSTYVTSYNIYSSMTSGSEGPSDLSSLLINLASPPTLPYNDTSASGALWYYEITAVDSCGVESAVSSPEVSSTGT